MVLRASVRRGDRLAGHRLVRGPDHAAGRPRRVQRLGDHKVKFDSPEVKEAAADFEKTLFTDGNVAGGRKSIASTAFGDADNPMFGTRSRVACCSSRATSSCRRTSSRERRGRRRQEHRRVRVPAGHGWRREPHARWRRHGHPSQRQRGRQGGHEDPGRQPDIGKDAAPTSSLHLPAQGLRPVALPERP